MESMAKKIGQVCDGYNLLLNFTKIKRLEYKETQIVFLKGLRVCLTHPLK